MATDVVMPALGVAQDSGRVVRWLRAEGEAVAEGEPLMEIETDKATVEIEAPASGTLAAVRTPAGGEVPVGTVIATILQPGDEAAARAAAVPRRRDGPRLAAASPKARRLASELGVDLDELAGRSSGPVRAADVLAAAGGAAPAAGAILRRMAERTSRSWGAPHFYLVRDVDAGALLAWRAQARARVASLTLTDLLLRVVAATLREQPQLRSQWRDGAVAPPGEVNVGLAVALDEGLVVPVLHGADALDLAAITERRAQLVAAARAGRLRPEDVQAGTFTLSNLGMYGVDAVGAVLNGPEAAILAVGRIAERVVPVGGLPAVRPMLTLTLSCDHRVLDGASAARFLGALAGLVEQPAGLVA